MIHISGVLVRSRPENIDKVKLALDALEGVEVHGANPDGRLVVTVEEHSDQGIADKVVRLQDLPGVIAASMIYHQFEDGSENLDEVSDETSGDETSEVEVSFTAAGSRPSQNSISQETQS